MHRIIFLNPIVRIGIAEVQSEIANVHKQIAEVHNFGDRRLHREQRS